MKRALLFALPLLAFALSGCGNDPNAGLGGIKTGDLAAAAREAISSRRGAAEPAAVDPAAARATVASNGVPIMFFRNEVTGASAYLAVVGNNNGIETWSGNERVSVSLRDGVLVATRGMGSDIMAARAPSAAALSAGTGQTSRDYVYLDGADQTQKVTYTCTLSSKGAETITVLGRTHATRHIVENCTGTQGTAVNHFWFEGGMIRQSSQVLVGGVGNLTLQRIID